MKTTRVENWALVGAFVCLAFFFVHEFLRPFPGWLFSIVMALAITFAVVPHAIRRWWKSPTA